MPFTKGQSGNPGGRPKENEEIKLLAQKHSKAAIARLAFWLKSKDPRASVAACTALLDRGFGKPAQALEHSGTLNLTHEEMLAQLGENDPE